MGYYLLNAMNGSVAGFGFDFFPYKIQAARLPSKFGERGFNSDQTSVGLFLKKKAYLEREFTGQSNRWQVIQKVRSKDEKNPCPLDEDDIALLKTYGSC